MESKQRILLVFLCCALGWLSACQNEEVGPQSNIGESDDIFAYDDGVLIGNEGTFTFGNASVDYYQPENGVHASGVFDQVNGLPLGDVLQSMYLDDRDLYLVVNNSARIAVVNPSTMRLRRDFGALGSPRYVRRYGERLFVSQLFDGKLWVLDANTGEVLNKWDTPGWTERMELVDSMLWVEDQVGGTLLGFNLERDTLQFQTDLPGGISDLIEAEGRLYAFAHAAVGSDLVEINPISGEIMRSSDFGAMDASFLNYNTDEDAFYFWAGGEIRKFRRADWVLQPASLYETGNANVGGFALDPGTGDWYYTDVLDFATRGWLYRLDPFFAPLDTIRTGFIPRIILRP
ncbi:hypothetical protein HZ996_09255 [Cryomorphaceae bacterium]|nr:hypothetical protein HZ996_09255 [Cryomorphaceae bacterium]